LIINSELNSLIKKYKIMENQNITNNPIQREEGIKSGVIAKSFLANVFIYMGSALAISGVIAYLFGTNANLISLLYNVSLRGVSLNMLGYFVLFSPFILVLLMGVRYKHFSAITLTLLFILFSTLMGMSLSTIFLVYTGASIFSTFLITSATFGVMAVLGYTTSTDLTKFGSILMMALIGIIIASIVNWFMNSATMDYVISMLGVLIFTGLTAYDVQKLKRIGSGVEFGQEEANKLAIMGALNLYLDFVNLFLFLLRFFGNRK